MIAYCYFWLFATLGVLCALGVLFSRHPITGAVNLIGVMLSISGIYALLSGPFLAIIQLLVYAAAIMMLVVFVIMVLNSARDRSTPQSGPGLKLGALLLPALLVVLMVGVLVRSELGVDPDARAGSAMALGEAMFAFEADAGGWYVLFEVVGLLLLASLTGAVLLAKHSLSSPKPVDEGDEQ